MSQRQRNLLMLVGVLLAAWPGDSQARRSQAQPERKVIIQPLPTREPRVALVIGNSAYKVGQLSNPVNDARDMRAALRGLGFEVLGGEDLNRVQMLKAVREFGQKIRGGGVGLFYFAGHGVQVNGRNYLIPIGAEITSEAEVEYESVEAGFVLAQMEEARNRLNIVVLDACRNNPFARSFRSGSRGLTVTRGAPSGTLIAYATAADDVASDGAGRNGLFTQELLSNVRTPGLTLEQVFRRTRTSVKSKSNGKQVPYEYSSVEGEDFYFIPPTVGVAPPVSAPVTESGEQSLWREIKDSGDARDLQAYLEQYPNGEHAPTVRARLRRLTEKPAAASIPTATSSGAASAPSPAVALPFGIAAGAVRSSTFTTAKVSSSGYVTRQTGGPAQWFEEDLGGAKLELVAVPGGEFMMGSSESAAREALADVQRYNKDAKWEWFEPETPQHRVRVSGFWMGRYEVTQAQWQAVMGSLPQMDAEFRGAQRPVVNVNWEEAMDFCRRLSAKTGREHRLPTEAEWEYAARAGTTTPFAFGETITPEVVNYDGNYPYGNAPKGTNRKQTMDVGSFGAANTFGLFDMQGNVWEWCQDWFGSYASGDVSDPQGPSSGQYRVLRGGSWSVFGSFCRSALRSRVTPGFRNRYNGLRVVVIARTP